MLRFRGFRASLNLSSGKRSGGEYYDDVPTWAINGAYRNNTEEDIENGGSTQTYKTITPSMVKLPSSSDSQSQPKPPRQSKGSKHSIKNISKSTTDLTQDDTTTSEASHSKSTGNVSLNPRGSNSYSNLTYVPDSNLGTESNKDKSKKKVIKNKEPKKEKVKDSKSTDKQAKKDSKNADKEAKRAAKEAKKVEKELKRQEKQRLEEQKKQDKLESQILAQEEKLQKAKGKAEMKKAKKEKDKSKPLKETSQTVVAQKPLTNPLAQGSRNTDTLQSSISKTSAPPPYSETKEDVFPKVVKNETKKEATSKVVLNESDGTGNTSFGKPISNAGSSWDMISQHREQINRSAVGGTKMKILNNSQYVTGRKSIYI